MKHTFNLENASTATLVDAFNFINPLVTADHKPVKKFADRKTAIRRVAQSLEAAPEEWVGSAQHAKLVSLFQGGESEPTSAPEPVAAKVVEMPAPVAKPAFEANVFQTEFLQALVNLIDNGKPSNAMLCDVEIQLSKRAKSGSGAQAILGALKAAGIVSETEAKDEEPTYLWLTVAGNDYCKRAGIVQQEAYKADKDRDPKLEKEQAKAAKAPKVPKEPKTKDDTFTYHPNPKRTPHAVRAGSKIAQIIDLIARPQGATMAELQALMSPKATVRGILQYDLNTLVGYGCSYDGKVVKIMLHAGMAAPLAHKTAEVKPAKKEKGA